MADPVHSSSDLSAARSGKSKSTEDKLSKERLCAEQVAILYQNAPAAYAITLINGSILAFIQRNHVPEAILLIWLATLATITLGRAILIDRYHRRVRPPSTDIGKWKLAYLAGTMLAGLTWGFAGIFLFPAESLGHQVFVAFVLAGMTAGAVGTLSARIEISLAFMLPALLPLAGMFLAQERELQLAMGIMILLFLCGMAFVSWQFHRSIVNSLQLHLDKRKLLARLALDKAQTDRLNVSLLEEIAERRKIEEALCKARDTLELRVKERTLELEKEIAERKAYETQLKHLAHHDSLTSLPNRMLLQDRLKQAIAHARRAGQYLAVLFVDMDRFKMINDSLGHTAGDALLKEVATRLKACIREGDTVARLGGDEFVIVVENLAQYQNAVVVARKALDEMKKAFRIDDQEFFVTCTIGISLFPANGDDAHTLLKNANAAMHRAKDRGRNDIQFYAADMNARTGERLALESSLRHALDRGELLLFYQPQVALNDNTVIGLEALLRWRHPRLGMISPAQFIPLAEETGLIIPIGAWVLQTACAQAKAWQAAGIPPKRMAVNLSPRQFIEAGLTDLVVRTLRETGLEAGFLELEITENLLMKDVKSAVETLKALKNIGVRLAVDDFGTGYSSLSYLKRFPIDRLKIDRSFVNDIPADADDVAITLAIITLAHNMNLQVIAEGVENQDQLGFLKAKHCDEVQGFYFSQPLPAKKILPLFKKSHLLSTSKSTSS